MKLTTFCAVLFGAALVGARSASAMEAPYKDPMPDSTNMRVVENHVIIDRPAKAVFDWIFAPENTPKWLSGSAKIKVTTATPNHVGTVMIESISTKALPGLSYKEKDKEAQYTTVAWVPDFMMVAVSQGVVDGKVSDKVTGIATWAVQPLPNNQSMFVRVFETFTPDGTVAPKDHAVVNPQIMQQSIERVKVMVEREVPKQ